MMICAAVLMDVEGGNLRRVRVFFFTFSHRWGIESLNSAVGEGD